MKILVTGGAGFIGSNFILYWLEKYANDEIVNLDALTYAGNLENLKHIQDDKRYTFVHGDIRDASVVTPLVQSADLVVHFAAESHVDRSISDPSSFVDTNVMGTHILLDACVKNGGVRFHHISTDEVFGSLSLEDDKKFSEQTPYDPRSPYSASKAGSDHLVRAYFHTFDLPITITNCSNNFGPYQFPEKFIPLAITNLLEHKKVPVYGDGKYVRDWLYVEDHCRGVDMVIKKGKIGDTYCIGGGDEDMSNVSIVKKILSNLDADESYIEYVKDRPGHDRRYAIDWSKIHSELGWKPLHDFDTWLAKTVNWYADNKQWWQSIKSGEYKDYYEKQYKQ